MTKNEAKNAVSLFTADEIAEYHDDYADDLPDNAVGYAEICVSNDQDWDHEKLVNECRRQIAGKFGPGFRLAAGVAEGDDFANNDCTSDDYMWGLFAIIKND